MTYSSPSSFSKKLCQGVMALSLCSAAYAEQWPDRTIPNGFGVQLKGHDANEENLDVIKSLGLKWVRRGFIWEAVEKEKGTYDFSKYDAFMKACKERGISVIGCIAFSNKAYGGHAKDEPGRSGYAKFAEAAAERYKDYDIIWEIWNEPNTMTFWGKHGKVGNTPEYAEEYLGLVKETVPAILRGNSKALILGGSVSGLWKESFKWMDAIFEMGVLKTGIHGWSVHPYSFKCPEDYFTVYDQMVGMMKKAGGPVLPIVNSERGFPIGKAEGYAGGDPALSHEYQAWHVVRQYLIDYLYGVKITIWYEWSGKEGFSLYRKSDPPPAFKATQVMIDELRGYTLDKRIDVESSRDFVLRFTNPQGGVKLAAWSSQPEGTTPDNNVAHKIKIPVEAQGSLATVQIYGEKGTVPVNAGAIELTVSGAPQYVTVK